MKKFIAIAIIAGFAAACGNSTTTNTANTTANSNTANGNMTNGSRRGEGEGRHSEMGNHANHSQNERENKR